MRRPTPLPATLPFAFTVGRAGALGVSVDRLRASDLDRPFHGTRARGPLDAPERLRLIMQALPPHAFVCGGSAAQLWDLPLPWHEQQRAQDEPCVGVPSDQTRIRRPGVRARRLQIEDHDVSGLGGLRVLAPARLWVDIAADLRVPDLVAVTDRILARRHPLATIDDLVAIDRRFRGSRGAHARREALDLCDAGAESPRESNVRVLLMHAGLPRPECNVDIVDGGRFIARVDMLFRDAKLVVEYDGDYHRDPDQWSRDQIRRAELESRGYRVTVITRRDLDDPERLVARIRRLLAASTR